MNASHQPGALQPDALVVDVFRDEDAAGWIAVSDEIPIATEAATIEALIERVWLIAPEVAELNGISSRAICVCVSSSPPTTRQPEAWSVRSIDV